MRSLRYLQSVLLLISLCIISCKSRKITPVTKSGEVSYNTQRSFDQHYYEGAKLKALGYFDDAIKEFKEALSLIPSSHDVMYQLANIHFKNKNNEEAIHWGEQALQKNPNYNFWYYGQLAQMYSVTGQYEKSAAIFVQMVEKEPERRSNYEEAGNQYLNAKKPKEALKFFEKSIAKFGPDEQSARKLEELYFDLGQPNEALRIIKKLSDSYPNDVKFLGLLAEGQVKAGKIAEAKMTYSKILAMDDTNGFACFGMADVLRREGDNDASFYYLSKGFEDKRVNIQHKIKVISSYYFLIAKDEKSKQQAFELGEKLLNAHPEDATSYQIYSDIHFAVNNLSESRDYLKKGLAIDGKDYRIWQKLFGLDVKLANNQFLYEDSKAALELFTTQPGLFVIYSQAALRVKEYDKAIDAALQGLDISFKPEEKIQFYLTLGDAWFQKGNHEKSDNYFEKALEIDQQNALALNNYAYNLFKRNTKLDKAEEMILRALKYDPNNGSYADTYGCILMATGKLAEAEIQIKKALELDGDNAEVLEHLGDVYAKQGKFNLASETYKKALKLDPGNKTIETKLIQSGEIK